MKKRIGWLAVLVGVAALIAVAPALAAAPAPNQWSRALEYPGGEQRESNRPSGVRLAGSVVEVVA